MQTSDAPPYDFMTSSFVSTAKAYQIRFGISCCSTPMLALKTINGASKYWVRVRVVSALSSVPTGSFLYSHTNATRFNADGFKEFFGDARQVKSVAWDINETVSCGNTVPDQSIYLGKKLGLNLQNNYFPDGAETLIGRTAFVPTDMDVSFPMKVKFAVIGDSDVSGNVELMARYNCSNTGSQVFFSEADAPSTSSGELSSSAVVTMGTGNTKYTGELRLDLSGINSSQTEGMQLLWLTVERDATPGNSNDTYEGNIAVIQLTPYYVSWTDGSHLMSY